MTAIERGQWVRITGGLMHRRGETREGVAEAMRQYPSGPSWRVIHPHTKDNWGWVNEEHLKVIPAPTYTPQVDQQAALNLLMGKS